MPWTEDCGCRGSSGSTCGVCDLLPDRGVSCLGQKTVDVVAPVAPPVSAIDRQREQSHALPVDVAVPPVESATCCQIGESRAGLGQKTVGAVAPVAPPVESATGRQVEESRALDRRLWMSRLQCLHLSLRLVAR